MDRNAMAKAVKWIGWGYFFLYINVTLGTINFLPAWVAYILMVRAIDLLGKEVPSLALLRPLGVLLGLWETVLWALSIVGLTPENYYILYALQLIAAALEIYFHFQLLTDLAAIAREAALPQERWLLRLRTVRTVLATAVAVAIQWSDLLPLAIFLAVAGIVVGLWICIVLFQFQKALAQAPPAAALK